MNCGGGRSARRQPARSPQGLRAGAEFEGKAHRNRRSVHAVADTPSSTGNLAITLGYFVGH